MKIIRIEDIEVEHRTPKGRGGSNHHYAIINPDRNGLDNFGLRMVEFDESFYSPRHHHNFAQYRYMLEGESDEAPEGKLKAGVLGFYPESAFYGPESGKPRKMLVLQFGALCGAGLAGREQMKNAIDALEKSGVFEDGKYRRNFGVEGKKVQDGFEAIWEYINQKSIEYPTPQYSRPILMDTSAFPWRPCKGAEGVEEKSLGTFTSARLRSACYRLASGARYSATGRGVYFILAGSGSVAGRPYSPYTSIYVEEHEVGELTASEQTEMLQLGLPTLDDMMLPVEPLLHLRQRSLIS
tara:strand:+ start:43021 stop:43908 length:888 start_codon:yes stop_codon:yes gene_type:complete